MTNEQKKQIIEQELNSPAFPPELIQDKFNQLVAPLPGMAKIEYYALMLLPGMLQKHLYEGDAVQNAIEVAHILNQKIVEYRLERQEPPKPTLSLT